MQTIYSILNGKTWTHVEKDFTKLTALPELVTVRNWKVKNSTLSEHQVMEMRKLWNSAPDNRGLAARLALHYGITVSSVRQIVTRVVWRHLPDDFSTLETTLTVDTLPEVPVIR